MPVTVSIACELLSFGMSKKLKDLAAIIYAYIKKYIDKENKK